MNSKDFIIINVIHIGCSIVSNYGCRKLWEYKRFQWGVGVYATSPKVFFSKNEKGPFQTPSEDGLELHT